MIFITRLVYREKAAPGKVIDLTRIISKNLIIAYIPSVIVAILILIVANIDNTERDV